MEQTFILHVYKKSCVLFEDEIVAFFMKELRAYDDVTQPCWSNTSAKRLK
jgi:hypothetical protein